MALCRVCHRGYDCGALDLVPYLEPAHRAEVAHAVLHVGLIGALRRLSGRRDASLDSNGDGPPRMTPEAQTGDVR